MESGRFDFRIVTRIASNEVNNGAFREYGYQVKLIFEFVSGLLSVNVRVRAIAALPRAIPTFFRHHPLLLEVVTDAGEQ